jgi:hypothetical protein
MGYNVNQKAYTLEFVDGEFAGIEVTLKSMPIGRMTRVMGGASAFSFAAENIATGLTGLGKVVNDMFSIIGKALIRWNLEEDGTPIPCVLSQCRESGKPVRPDKEFCKDHDPVLIKREFALKHPEAEIELWDEDPEPCDTWGFMGLDAKLAGEIVEKWVQAVVGVDPTSSNDSKNGETFPEVRIPMELLSQNRPS